MLGPGLCRLYNGQSLQYTRATLTRGVDRLCLRRDWSNRDTERRPICRALPPLDILRRSRLAVLCEAGGSLAVLSE